MSAEFSFNHGQKYPFDADGENVAREPADWAVKAARGIFADLTDRRGSGLEDVDHDIREEMVDSVAEIIRFAAKAAGL
jgi:hypothetical protein